MNTADMEHLAATLHRKLKTQLVLLAADTSRASLEFFGIAGDDITDDELGDLFDIHLEPAIDRTGVAILTIFNELVEIVKVVGR